MPESGTDPLIYGLVLMVVGIAVVFAFLTLMIFAITASAKIIARFVPAPVPAPAAPPVQLRSDREVQVAVMLAAVRHARKGR